MKFTTFDLPSGMSQLIWCQKVFRCSFEEKTVSTTSDFSLLYKTYQLTRDVFSIEVCFKMTISHCYNK